MRRRRRKRRRGKGRGKQPQNMHKPGLSPNGDNFKEKCQLGWLLK